MTSKFLVKSLLLICITLIFCLASGSRLKAQDYPPSWSEPFPAFRVIGNLYGVGTAGLSVFLVTSDAGHILINTGLEDSTAIIRENIESLGFHIDDIEILLTMQAHYDHTAAMAEIRELSGAEVWAIADDARLLQDGGLSDPHFGGEVMFPPVTVDKIIKHGDVIELGETRLLVHEHPGHTEGSSSYSMVVHENGRDYDVAIANMGTINDGKRLFIDPTYAGAGEDFAMTYERQKAMDIDVWVAAHGEQYDLQGKYEPGQTYNPDTFVDPDGFFAEVERLENTYREKVAAERRQ